MNDSQKFYSDVRRLMKYERAENGSAYDARTVCTKAAALFSSANRGLGGLPDALAEYWITAYIDSSSDLSQEPSEQNLERLAAMQSFLDGSEDGTEILSEKDWQEIGSIVSCEAEDLPLDVLNTLMSTLVEKKALN